MKARRFFAFVASVAMLFAGGACTPDGGDEDSASEAEITVAPASIATTLEGSVETLTVTSNAKWVATCDQSDVVISTVVGNGNATVTLTIPAVTTARTFDVKFLATKQIEVAGIPVPSNDEAIVTVSQNASGVDMNDYLYYEDCGADVEKITLENGNTAWPYIDQFSAWNPKGSAATNVTYTGQSASVRDSGVNYDPTEDAVGLSGAPYVFLNKVPAQAHFVIENLAVTGGQNYIFTYNVSCQNGYNPLTFAAVDNTLVHLELGYDGQIWDAVDCTFAPNGGNGWYAASAEFKVAANATTLYARFTYEAPASNGGGRFDDFKLVEGGTGAELVPEVPAAPELPEQPTDPLAIPYSETFEQNQGYFTINDVLLGDGLTYVWKHENGQYGYYMKASAYKDGAKASESWLISPEISLVGATAPAVSFEHAHKFAGTPSEELTLWISEDKGENWAQLTIPAYTSNNDYTFVANTIDLTSYVGKNVKIAFKYVATSSAAGTWEVKNFKVAEKSTAVEPEPEITETITGLSHIENLDGVTAGKYYFAAYSTKNSSEEVFTKFPYHLWTGTVTSGKADTANYAFADGVLSRDPKHTSAAPETEVAVEAELVAVEGKTNVYYIKFDNNYLSVTDYKNNHKLVMGETALEWTAVEHTDGVVFQATDGTDSVTLCTGTAANDLLRQYKTSSFENSISKNQPYNGVHLFKKN